MDQTDLWTHPKKYTPINLKKIYILKAGVQI